MFPSCRLALAVLLTEANLLLTINRQKANNMTITIIKNFFTFVQTPEEAVISAIGRFDVEKLCIPPLKAIGFAITCHRGNDDGGNGRPPNREKRS